MCERDEEIRNDQSIVAQVLFRNADGLRFIRLDVALRIIDGRKVVRNAVRMERCIVIYSVHMGVDEWREELCQREQK